MLRIQLTEDQKQAVRKLRGRYSAHLEEGFLVIAKRTNAPKEAEPYFEEENKEEDDLLA